MHNPDPQGGDLSSLSRHPTLELGIILVWLQTPTLRQGHYLTRQHGFRCRVHTPKSIDWLLTFTYAALHNLVVFPHLVRVVRRDMKIVSAPHEEFQLLTQKGLDSDSTWKQPRNTNRWLSSELERHVAIFFCDSLLRLCYLPSLPSPIWARYVHTIGDYSKVLCLFRRIEKGNCALIFALSHGNWWSEINEVKSQSGPATPTCFCHVQHSFIQSSCGIEKHINQLTFRPFLISPPLSTNTQILSSVQSSSIPQSSNPHLSL